MTGRTSASVATRERLLVAAERLLLTERYEDVSVRGICATAGANPAAVHYHFGSKEALVAALIEDRLGSLWADRLAAATTGGGSVAQVVDAVIEPFVELAADPVGRLHLRLLVQLFLGRYAMTWTRHWFQMESWVGLLPEVGERESRRRWSLAFELIIMRFGGAANQQREMSDEAVSTLRDFVVAGLTAARGEES